MDDDRIKDTVMTSIRTSVALWLFMPTAYCTHTYVCMYEYRYVWVCTAVIPLHPSSCKAFLPPPPLLLSVMSFCLFFFLLSPPGFLFLSLPTSPKIGKRKRRKVLSCTTVVSALYVSLSYYLLHSPFSSPSYCRYPTYQLQLYSYSCTVRLSRLLTCAVQCTYENCTSTCNPISILYAVVALQFRSQGNKCLAWH